MKKIVLKVTSMQALIFMEHNRKSKLQVDTEITESKYFINWDFVHLW